MIHEESLDVSLHYECIAGYLQEQLTVLKNRDTKRWGIAREYLMCGIEPNFIDELSGALFGIGKTQLKNKIAYEWSFADNDIIRKEVNINLFANKYLSNADKVIKNGYSLLFFGKNGVGKSFLARVIAAKFVKLGIPTYVISHKDLYQYYNIDKFDNNSEFYGFYNYLINIPFLVIDELGKEGTKTESAVYFIEDAIKTRTSRNLPTAIITNLNLGAIENAYGDSIQEIYGDSVMSILAEKYKAFAFSSQNKDLRSSLSQEWDLG